MALGHSTSFVTWRNPAQERAILDDIALDVPWSVVEQFSSLVRLSGSPEERAAFEFLIRHLGEWEIGRAHV